MERLLLRYLFIIFISGILYADTITVALDGTSDFYNIQAAIDSAVDTDIILVRDGTYTGDGNRDIDFKGKAVTVRSENGPEKCIIDCQATSEDRHRGFYFHNSEDKTSILDGFTIINGYARAEDIIVIPDVGPAITGEIKEGGGILCMRSSPGIYNCIIKNCRAEFGGGIATWLCDAYFENCIITENTNGGVVLKNGTPVLKNCKIISNTGGLDDYWIIFETYLTEAVVTTQFIGGGITIFAGNASLTNCEISQNKCDDFYEYFQPDNDSPAGGLYSLESLVQIKNCLFSGNVGYYGTAGAISVTLGGTDIDNCTFVGNRSIHEEGTASIHIYNLPDSGWEFNGADPNIAKTYVHNSIFWDNRNLSGLDNYSPSSSLKNNKEPIFDHCNIYDPYNCIEGHDNIYVDPMFALDGYWDDNDTPDDWTDDTWIDGDYHLMSQAGRWDRSTMKWVTDDVTSPCIDTGAMGPPIGTEPFPNGGIINMGAYGGTPQASKSFFGSEPCSIIVAGDINGDCIVNLADFSFIAYHWLENFQ